MKKILIATLTVIFMSGFATATMAAATFSGEIDVAMKGSYFNQGFYNELANDRYDDIRSYDYSLGKMILNGSLGDDLTGTLAFTTDTEYFAGEVLVDEASITFTEDWGSLKLGYYGWNNNLKDIVNAWTIDIKSQANISTSIKLTDNLNLGLDYAFTGSTPKYYWLDDTQDNFLLGVMGGYKNPFGADLGYAGDTFGGDLLYFNYNDFCTAWGFNTWMKLGDFKPFVQYRYMRFDRSFLVFDEDENEEIDIPVRIDGDANSTIFGVTYEPDDIPIYIRAEVALANGFDATFHFPGYNEEEEPISVSIPSAFNNTPWGMRLGYKLGNGAKVEVQYRYYGIRYYDPVLRGYISSSGTDYYLKLICNF